MCVCVNSICVIEYSNEAECGFVSVSIKTEVSLATTVAPDLAQCWCSVGTDRYSLNACINERMLE